MTDPAKILQIHDDSGNFQGVLIPAALWRKCEPLLKNILQGDEAPIPADDMTGFDEFMRVWDFHYSYDPAVKCPCCDAHSEDWRKDSHKRFCLVNANIGGLLVFHCKNCGATIRHKYFRRHMAVEFTPPGQ